MSLPPMTPGIHKLLKNIPNLNRPELVHSSHDGRLQMSDFQRFLVLCEQLQLIGTTIYFPSALFLIFSMFYRVVFPIVSYALTGTP